MAFARRCCWRQLAFTRLAETRRSCSTSSTDHIRNFGIIAHIDAGKTTVSERMLYYTGRTRQIGEVHEGDTVMDFMEEERKRGITITSACVTMPWKGYHMNLIDSPGHVDFTLEVERCCAVLDGAIAVVDGVAGVQVQTETVWRQANKHDLPRIVFVNKLDRVGASLDVAVASIAARLGVTPLVTQVPLYRAGHLVGVVDLLDMEEVTFEGPQGQTVLRTPTAEGIFADQRENLLETLSHFDDELLEAMLEDDKAPPSSSSVRAALRRVLGSNAPACPVLCGAAYRNIGVQPLLDAVCDYLPSPAASLPSDPFAALVFKVVHDRQRGPIALARIYSGSVSPRDALRIRDVKGRVAKVLHVDAGAYDEVNVCTAGHICGLVGLKQVRTGDVLAGWDAPAVATTVMFRAIDIPAPVFFCSIEAESSAQQADLDAALAALASEDPSIVVANDSDTGQTVVKGMGELHLEIIRNRLLSEFGVSAQLGRMSVSYRETISAGAIEQSLTHQGGNRPSTASVTVAIRLSPAPDSDDLISLATDHASVTCHDASSGLPRALPDIIFRAIRDAINDTHGPLLGFPLGQIRVDLTDVRLGADSNVDDVRTAISRCLTMGISAAVPVLLEPVVDMEIRCDREHVGAVVSDLTFRRRAQIGQVLTPDQDLHGTIDATVPLAELIGYSTASRSISQGTAHYSTRFRGYAPVPARQQAQILQGSTPIS